MTYNETNKSDPWAVPGQEATGADLPEQRSRRGRRIVAAAMAGALLIAGAAYAWHKSAPKNSKECTITSGKSFILSADDVHGLLYAQSDTDAPWTKVDADMNAALQAVPGAHGLRGLSIVVASRSDKTSQADAEKTGQAMFLDLESHFRLDPAHVLVAMNFVDAGLGNSYNIGDVSITPITTAPCGG